MNNSHMLELGSEEEVEQAVTEAMATLRPNGRFMLAPGDALLRIDPRVEANFHRMVETWRHLA